MCRLLCVYVAGTVSAMSSVAEEVVGSSDVWSKPVSSVEFALAAQQVNRLASSWGLQTCGFRCPPAVAGVNRSLRTSPEGRVTVAVLVRGRCFGDVLADVVDGVLVANASLTPEQALEFRSAVFASFVPAEAPDPASWSM